MIILYVDAHIDFCGNLTFYILATPLSSDGQQSGRIVQSMPPAVPHNSTLESADIQQ